MHWPTVDYLHTSACFVISLVTQRLKKKFTCSAGASGDAGSTPGSERSPGEGHGNPLQYCCLENPMDRGAWWAAAHRVAESDTTEMTALTHARFVENDLLRVTGGLFYLLGSLGYQAVLHRFVLGNTSLSCVSDPTAFVTIRVCMFRNIIPDSWVQCNVNWNRRS